jgi:hypothetical protein
MPEISIKRFMDLYLMFYFLYYAKTFRSVANGPYYEYSFGAGVSTCPLDAKQFEKVCTASEILPAIEWFLKRENALDKKRFLLDSIKTILKSDVVNKLLALPEITKETIDLTVKSWGSEFMYDFLKATGLLDVKCESRLNLVTMLVEQIRKQNRLSASGRTATLSVGQPVK